TTCPIGRAPGPSAWPCPTPSASAARTRPWPSGATTRGRRTVARDARWADGPEPAGPDEGEGRSGTNPAGGLPAGPDRPRPAGGESDPRPPRAGEPGWLQRVAAMTGVVPAEPALFLEALTHASYRAEHPDTAGADNERLE